MGLSSNNPKGSDNIHSVGFKLSSTLGTKAGFYMAPLKLKIMQV